MLDPVSGSLGYHMEERLLSSVGLSLDAVGSARRTVGAQWGRGGGPRRQSVVGRGRGAASAGAVAAETARLLWQWWAESGGRSER